MFGSLPPGTDPTLDHMRDTLRPTAEQAAAARGVLDDGFDAASVLIKVTGGVGRDAVSFWQGTETVTPIDGCYPHNGPARSQDTYDAAVAYYEAHADEQAADPGFALFEVILESADRLRQQAAENGEDLDALDDLARDHNVAFSVWAVHPPRD